MTGGEGGEESSTKLLDSAASTSEDETTRTRTSFLSHSTDSEALGEYQRRLVLSNKAPVMEETSTITGVPLSNRPAEIIHQEQVVAKKRQRRGLFSIFHRIYNAAEGGNS